MTDSVCCEDDIGRSRRTGLFHYGSKLIWFFGVISLFLCLKSLRDYKHEGGQISGVGERFQTNRHLLSEDNPDSNRRVSAFIIIVLTHSFLVIICCCHLLKIIYISTSFVKL